MIIELFGYVIVGGVMGYWCYYKLIDRLISTWAFLYVGFGLIAEKYAVYSDPMTWIYVIAVGIGYYLGKYLLHYGEKWQI